VEQTQVGEDGAHHGRVLHRGDAPQPTATARAGEDIEIEHAAHQGGPGPRARGAGGAGAGLALARMEVRGRAGGAQTGGNRLAGQIVNPGRTFPQGERISDLLNSSVAG